MTTDLPIPTFARPNLKKKVLLQKKNGRRILLYKKTVGWHRPTGTSKPRRACWVPSLGVLGLPSGVLGLSLGVLGLSLDVLGLNVGVLRLRLGVPGLNLDVPGQVSKLKTPFFRWFCMQATQHCANAPTLTKHWQERQKSRFCTFHKLCAQAPKPHQIDLGACHTKLSTKIVLETGLWSCRASFWKGLGLSWVARDRLLNALERLVALLGRFLDALGRV